MDKGTDGVKAEGMRIFFHFFLFVIKLKNNSMCKKMSQGHKEKLEE
jgi:hypothetical protein